MAYADLDQTLPGGVQNDHPSRDVQVQMKNQSESTSGGCKAINDCQSTKQVMGDLMKKTTI